MRNQLVDFGLVDVYRENLDHRPLREGFAAALGPARGSDTSASDAPGSSPTRTPSHAFRSRSSPRILRRNRRCRRRFAACSGDAACICDIAATRMQAVSQGIGYGSVCRPADPGPLGPYPDNEVGANLGLPRDPIQARRQPQGSHRTAKILCISNSLLPVLFSRPVLTPSRSFSDVPHEVATAHSPHNAPRRLPCRGARLLLVPRQTFPDPASAPSLPAHQSLRVTVGFIA
jgi:hypothetical protein